MAFEKVENDVVLQLESHKALLALPLKQSERIKYTCFAVSKNFLIFGATSGGLYAFKRSPYIFWQLIPSKESAITILSISPCENFIAFATTKNIVCILELNEQTNCKLVIRTDDLVDSEITALCWSDDFHKPTLYIGDGCGRVSSLKLSFLNKNILHLPTTLSMTLDSRVIQLCWQNNYLLASTYTRCFLCDTVREQFKQIGQQLRDGHYGATFVCKGSNVRIFCARPGSRLWEVDLDAVVHSTHQFKGLLATPPTPFISIFDEPRIVEIESTDLPWAPQSFNFVKLYDLLGTYVVTFKKDALYILNVDMVNVFFWNNCFGEVVDVQCVSNTIFVWNSNGELYEFVVLPLSKCLLTLFLRHSHDLCATIICRWYDKVMSQESDCLTALSPLCDLECSQLDEDETKLLNEFKDRIRACTSYNIKLNSGIHVVNNRHFSTRLLDDSDSRLNHQSRSLSASDSEEIRKRSHSLPPTLKENEKVDSGAVRDHIIEEQLRNHRTHEASRYFKSDNLYLETGLYNSPFISLASYQIVEECISDLSSSVSEKLSESSKSLKQKWGMVEHKLKFLRSAETTGRNDAVNENVVDNNNTFIADNMNVLEENNEPVVEPRQRKSTEVSADYDKIIELCGREDADDFELLNFVVCEYQTLVKKYGIAKYEQFPFLLPERSLVRMKEIFEQLLTNDSLLRWFGHEHFPMNVDVDLNDVYPPLLVETFSPEDLRFDFLLCKTLVIFTEIMNAPTILETVKLLNLPCYYMSFCYIMKYFQSDQVLELNSYAKGNSAHWPLPVYLNTMLLMISLDQADVFCEMGIKRKVDPTEVMYMMFHLEHNENETSSSNKYKNICLIYLQKLYERQDFLSDSDAYVISLASKMFLSINVELDMCCSCCWFLLPGPSSPKIEFLELGKKILSFLWDVFLSACNETNSISQELMLIIRGSISATAEYKQFSNPCYKNDESCQHVICAKLAELIPSPSELVLLSFNIVCNFCYRAPDLWRYLCELQSCSRFKILSAEHFIQLGNMAEMESSFLQLSPQEARTIFTLKSKLSDGFCLNCDSKIPVIENEMSYNDLTLFILRRLGGKSCLRVLEAFAGKIKLEKSFYRSILLSTIPGVSSELMSPIASTISSQFEVVPVSKKVAEELDKAIKLDLSDSRSILKKSEAHHWGMKINVDDSNQAICYCCSLPLFSKYLIKEDNGGIMLFSCNHTYHTICLKNKDCTATCLVCDRFLG